MFDVIQITVGMQDTVAAVKQKLAMVDKFACDPADVQVKILACKQFSLYI